MKDDDDLLDSPGSVTFNTVKAGCGIRFDPDQLDEQSGFDFSNAGELNTSETKAEKTKPHTSQ